MNEAKQCAEMTVDGQSPQIGRGNGMTLKDFKKSLNEYLRRKGMQRKASKHWGHNGQADG